MVQSPPKVSVVMPAYNCARFFPEAISSVIRQTYDNLEILVMDDGSRDGTEKLLANINDPRVARYHRRENRGYLETCNELFRLASGDLITFQDADDYSEPDRIEQQVTAFLQDPELGACGTNCVYLSESGVEERRSDFQRSGFEDGWSYSYTGQFCMATVMIRREVYERIGGYRKYFSRIGNEDFDWMCRILENYRVINLPGHLYCYRQVPSSVSKTLKRPEQLYGLDIVAFLARERAASGSDALMTGKMNDLNAFIAALRRPYEEDASLIYRKAAERNLYLGQCKNAVVNSCKAIYASPGRLINYRTLFYCVRKVLMQ